jgi:hypothetical protein
MVVALIALFISLTGVAWAAIENNSVKSKHIKDGQVKEADLAPGAVTTLKLADGSVTTAKVVDETLVGDDLADETVTGSKIADGTLTAQKIAGGITGQQIEDGSLGGADIDEASLVGLTKASGSSCCTVSKAFMHLTAPYSPSDPLTFVSLGPSFELRTTATGDGDEFRFCKLTGTTFDTIGAYAYLSGVRDVLVFTNGAATCKTLDVNGASSGVTGDFELLLPGTRHVWGEMSTTDSFASITILGP